MRQQFGKKMIELLTDGIRILNIDETWIAQTNFRRRSWQPRVGAESDVLCTVSPRITMIAALDNFGDVYISLLQYNTNQYTFAEYVQDLADNLDEDRPGWRKNTVWQLDGAKYHKTPMLKELLQKLKIKAMISAPYSYDGAVAELFFSMFKRDHINIQELATSKSKFHSFLILAKSSLIIYSKLPSPRLGPCQSRTWLCSGTHWCCACMVIWT